MMKKRNVPSDEALAPFHPWIGAFALWPRLDEHVYRLVLRACGVGQQAPQWSSFSSLLTREGVARRVRDPAGYTPDPEWLPMLEAQLEALGGAGTARALLLGAWLAQPDPFTLPIISQFGLEAERWDVLEQTWLLLGEHTTGLRQETLLLFRDLPVEARRARPILTWASGAAASLLAPAGQQAGLVLRRLLLDSVMLHADWSVRDDTDEAVSAGTFRMIGEGHLPTAQGGRPLDAAWQTKQEVDAFIDRRSRAGRPPGRTSHAIFRAFASRLALGRFDTHNAINEANWATVLADWEPLETMAAGVQALARSVSTEEGPAHHSEPPVVVVDDDLGVRGFRGQGHVFEILADGNEAVRRLDRECVDRCLALVSSQTAGLAGLWTVRVALEAWRAVLWGDIATGIRDMTTSVQRLSLTGREHEEPLGAALMSRVRVVLLIRSGVFGAATQVAETLPDNLKLLSQARVRLWAGHYREAIALADAWPFQPTLSMIDRHRLAMIRVGAALLDGSMNDTLRGDAIREAKRLLQHETFLNIALLPPPAREAFIELVRPHIDPSAPAFQLLLQRLAQLNDSGQPRTAPIRLTQREQVLLPLLAGGQPVPEIARNLHVSVNTVRKQVVSLREKFGAGSREELIRKARIHGAVP